MHKKKASGAFGMGDSATAKPILQKKGGIDFNLKGYAECDIIRANGEKEHIDPHPNAITGNGFEWIGKFLYDATRPAGPGNFLGLSKNGTDVSSGDNPSITDIGDGGLIRAVADEEEYDADNTTMEVKKKFTNSSGADVTGIQTLTLYNELSGGILVHVVVLGSAFTLSDGDAVEVTWKIVLSEPTG